MPVSEEFVNWLKSQVKPAEGYTQEETFQAVTETTAKEYGIECNCIECNNLTPINYYNENKGICDKCNHRSKSREYLNFFNDGRGVFSGNEEFTWEYYQMFFSIPCMMCKERIVTKYDCVCADCCYRFKYEKYIEYYNTLRYNRYKYGRRHLSQKLFKEKMGHLESFYDEKVDLKYFNEWSLRTILHDESHYYQLKLANEELARITKEFWVNQK